MRISAAAFFLCALAASFSQAATLSGRVKLGAIGYDAGDNTVEQWLNFKRSHEREGELRVALNEQLRGFGIDAAGVWNGRNGSAVARDLAMVRYFPILARETPDEAWWDMSATYASGVGSTASAFHGRDRPLCCALAGRP